MVNFIRLKKHIKIVEKFQIQEVEFMNKVTLMGNLTRDPDVRYSQGEKSTCVVRYTLGIRRRFHRDGDPDSDFINCVAFGKQGEFAEKYLKKGMKIAICGRIQTGSYTDKDGIKRYTTDVVVEEHYFVESKNANNGNASNSQSAPQNNQPAASNDGFMSIPEGIEEELPFI